MTGLDPAAIMAAHAGHRTDKFGVCREKFWSGDVPCLPYRLAAEVVTLRAQVAAARAEALRDAADAWQQGEWANAPRRPDRVQERIANGQFVGDWLRARAGLATEPKPLEDEGELTTDHVPGCDLGLRHTGNCSVPLATEGRQP